MSKFGKVALLSILGKFLGSPIHDKNEVKLSTTLTQSVPNWLNGYESVCNSPRRS